MSSVGRQNTDAMQDPRDAGRGDIADDFSVRVECVEIHDGRRKRLAVRLKPREWRIACESPRAQPLDRDGCLVGHHVHEFPLHIGEAPPHEINDAQISFCAIKRRGRNRRRERGGGGYQLLAQRQVIGVDSCLESPHCLAVSFDFLFFVILHVVSPYCLSDSFWHSCEVLSNHVTYIARTTSRGCLRYCRQCSTCTCGCRPQRRSCGCRRPFQAWTGHWPPSHHWNPLDSRRHPP